MYLRELDHGTRGEYLREVDEGVTPGRAARGGRHAARGVDLCGPSFSAFSVFELPT